MYNIKIFVQVTELNVGDILFRSFRFQANFHVELDIQQNTEQFILDFPTNLNGNLKKSKA
jgi:hypothetical protein